MFAEIIFIIFILCMLVQTGYVLSFFGHIFSVPRKVSPYSATKRATIVICAHNEAQNLRINLPVILAQIYANDNGTQLYEVIVVDDVSTDDTPAVLKSFQSSYPYLKVVTVSSEDTRLYPGKKHALSQGVAAAGNDILVFTDADCMPAGTRWLQRIMQPFHQGKELVVGYGKYRNEDSLLNAFVRWETMHTFLQYSSYTMAGRPYMGVGRNIACTKEAFLEAQKLPEWSMLPSGDDDLLINATANKNNTAVVANVASFTITDAKPDVNKWMNQKRRHLSTGKYYKFFTKVLLAKYAGSHALIWLTFIISLFTSYWELTLTIMTLRCMIYWLIWWFTACMLGEKKIIRYFPLFDIGWMIYNFAFSPYILLKNKQQWK